LRSLAIVDVDSTLVHNAEPLFKELRKYSPDLLPPSQWTHWDYLVEHIPKDIFLSAVTSVQMRIGEEPPLPGAYDLLEWLYERYTVVIASDRAPECYDSLTNWLYKYHLLHDQVHVSPNKTVLFPEAAIVVDDSPRMLVAARQMGVPIAVGIRYPWNKNLGLTLVKDLFWLHDALITWEKTHGNSLEDDCKGFRGI